MTERRVGQVVVCVDDSPAWGSQWRRKPTGLVRGQSYTILEICPLGDLRVQEVYHGLFLSADRFISAEDDPPSNVAYRT